MKSKKTSRKHAKNPGGFWDRSGEPEPGVISVRNSSSRLARASAFLLKFLGLGRRANDD